MRVKEQMSFKVLHYSKIIDIHMSEMVIFIINMYIYYIIGIFSSKQLPESILLYINHHV